MSLTMQLTATRVIDMTKVEDVTAEVLDAVTAFMVSHGIYSSFDELSRKGIYALLWARVYSVLAPHFPEEEKDEDKADMEDQAP